VTIRGAPAPAPASTPESELDGAAKRGRRMRARWLVHLGLIAVFAGSLATVVLIPEGTPHVLVGLAFVAAVGIHVVQRRHTVMRLLGNLVRAHTWFSRRGRLAWSDMVLALLTVNLLASGTYDLLSGSKVMLHPRDVGIPFRDIGWHALSAIVLLAYLCVHVARRWGRLRRSVIR
jgi:hypothetical protein